MRATRSLPHISVFGMQLCSMPLAPYPLTRTRSLYSFSLCLQPTFLSFPLLLLFFPSSLLPVTTYVCIFRLSSLDPMLVFLYLLLSPRSSLVAHRNTQTDRQGAREGEGYKPFVLSNSDLLPASHSFVSSHLQLFTTRECCCLGHISSCIVRVTVLMHFPNSDLQFFKSRLWTCLCLCPPLSEVYRGVNVLCVCLSNMCSLITSPPPFSYLCPVSAFCIVRSSSCLLYVPRVSGRGSFAVSASLPSFSMSVASSPIRHVESLSMSISMYRCLFVVVYDQGRSHSIHFFTSPLSSPLYP